MSKLAELLAARGAVPANHANRANPQAQISSTSRISSGAPQISPTFQRRIEAMALRWQYSDAELADVLARARANHAGWVRAVELDERREAEFRELRLLPKVDG